jgi:hypothetical protein
MESPEKNIPLKLLRIPYDFEIISAKMIFYYLETLCSLQFKNPLRIIFPNTIKIDRMLYLTDFLLILLSMLIIKFSFYHSFAVSYWYHQIRSQSVLKNYGVIMTLEIIDKIAVNLGKTLIVDRLWKQITEKKRIFSWKTFFLLIYSTIYVITHTIILFIWLMVYNVIFNSDWAFLIVMVFVHNSMKLKSTLMKKVTLEGYALAIFADIRCRF